MDYDYVNKAEGSDDTEGAPGYGAYGRVADQTEEE